MNPDISVIVPVYKVEPYLRQCLDSLINQTKKEIEILLIDDESPDTCGQICDEYAEKDDRIIVIHQENQGLAETRNIGVATASADYIMFVDSDDWVSPKFCETAFQLINEIKADMVLFEFAQIEDKTGKVIKREKYPMIEGYKTIPEALELISTSFGNYAWNKIYRKELFDNIRYPKGRLFEDVAVTYKLILKANRIWYTKEILYFYRCRESSIVTTRAIQNAMDSYDMSMQQLRDLQRFQATKAMAERRLRELHLSFCINYGKKYSEERYREAEQTLINLKPSIPFHYTWKRKIMLVLFWHWRWMFELLCVLFSRRVKLK